VKIKRSSTYRLQSMPDGLLNLGACPKNRSANFSLL
jgi:hypothetical protein